MNTDQVKRLLRQRFAAPEWAIAFEVANSTGGAARRYADAIAMNLWPSRGFAVHGFEIKVSRSDWKKELSQPGKADVIWQYCDLWTIVATKGVIANAAEVPAGWGWIEASENGLRQIIVPTQRTDATPLSRGFIAALARRFFETGDAHYQRAVAAAVHAAITPTTQPAEGRRLVLSKRQATPQTTVQNRDSYEEKYNKLKAERDAFEQLTGIKLSAYTTNAPYQAEQFKKAVTLIRRLPALSNQLTSASQTLLDAAAFVALLDPKDGDHD